MTRTLLPQALLRDGMTFDELSARHAVHAKPYNGKVSFVYDQIEAKASDPVACQCRGLILREGTWDVLAYPFDRFFNYGQVEAEGLDLATSRFFEKLDGTLIIAYFADGLWHAATRSMAEAHAGHNGITFRQLAEKACVEMGRGSFAEFMSEADVSCTYMFELTAPENQVVCEYRERKLSLLGVRSNLSFEEQDPIVAADRYGWPVPRTWEFSNLDHIVEMIRDWDPGQFEGVIACDAQFHRVKVKSPKYLAVHHATDSLGSSWRSCMAAVVTGAADDIERYVPAFIAGRIELCRDRLHKLIEETTADLVSIQHIDNMKEFASHATKMRFSGALFAVKRGMFDSVAEFVAQHNPERLVELCRIEESP